MTTEKVWDRIDSLIVDKRILMAIQAIRQEKGIGLHDALELLVSRYRMLREGVPERFTCSDEEYWKGFYS